MRPKESLFSEKVTYRLRAFRGVGHEIEQTRERFVRSDLGLLGARVADVDASPHLGVKDPQAAE